MLNLSFQAVWPTAIRMLIPGEGRTLLESQNKRIKNMNRPQHLAPKGEKKAFWGIAQKMPTATTKRLHSKASCPLEVLNTPFAPP